MMLSVLLATLCIVAPGTLFGAPKETTAKTPQASSKNATVTAKSAEPTTIQVTADSLPPVAAPETKKAKKEKDKRKTISDMNYDELKAAKKRYLEANNKDSALKFMQKMVPLCSDLTERGQLMLEVADTLFDLSDPEQAGTMYQEFSTMYPGHERIAYASKRAIECSFATILIPERDQTATKNTIELAQAFLKEDAFRTFHAEVQTILDACHQRLFESEVSIVQFYLHQQNIGPAQRRIADLRTTMVPVLPSCEQKVIELEYKVALLTDNTEEIIKKHLELSERAPEKAPTLIIAKNKVPKHQSRRF